MSRLSPIEELKEERKKVEEALHKLEEEKKNIDEEYASILEEEKKVYEQMRRCRDAYQYSRLEIRLNMIMRNRKEVEARKEEVERRIRGYKEDLARIEKRIQYLTPKKTKV